MHNRSCIRPPVAKHPANGYNSAGIFGELSMHVRLVAAAVAGLVSVHAFAQGVAPIEESHPVEPEAVSQVNR